MREIAKNRIYIDDKMLCTRQNSRNRITFTIVKNLFHTCKNFENPIKKHKIQKVTEYKIYCVTVKVRYRITLKSAVKCEKMQ